jgi:uncharacterized protein (TIGR02145 family)
MKNLFFVLALFFVVKTNAQDYYITFAGTGESVNVSTVKVENLAKGTSLTLNGSDKLHLTSLITGVKLTEDKQTSELKIYPNPMIDKSTMEIYPPFAGDAIITVCEMTGKPVAQIQSYLDKGKQEFHFTGLNYGIYLLIVRGDGYQMSGKLICNGKSNGKISIEKASNNIQSVNEKKSITDQKGTQATVDMEYSTGDRLKLTGNSGICTTIIMDIPTTSKLVTFTFIVCTDGDGNNYPVVQVGTGKGSPQIWMAENLKTTKLNDGTTIIPNVTGNTSWRALSTPGYCLFNNGASNKEIFGALYNWYSVNTRKLCPTGWHVPGDADWTTYTEYLGGENVAGGKLKETGTAHWVSPNLAATNVTGFTALPGGYRKFDGGFSPIGYYCKLWSATEYDATYSWSRYISNSDSKVIRTLFEKKAGLSVRCIKD